MIEKIEKLIHIPKQKLIKIIVIVLLISMLGIFLSESFSKKTQNEKAEDNNTDSSLFYELSTEKKLTKILSQIDGIGKVKVMVTLDSSAESIYSSDRENSTQNSGSTLSTSEKKKYLIVDNDGEEPVLEKELKPTIRGVIVVCEGADNVEVREAVTQSINAGLGVPLSNISVVRGGKNG